MKMLWEYGKEKLELGLTISLGTFLVPDTSASLPKNTTQLCVDECLLDG
jgi:hypothetical protein